MVGRQSPNQSHKNIMHWKFHPFNPGQVRLVLSVPLVGEALPLDQSSKMTANLTFSLTMREVQVEATAEQTSCSRTRVMELSGKQMDWIHFINFHLHITANLSKILTQNTRLSLIWLNWNIDFFTFLVYFKKQSAPKPLRIGHPIGRHFRRFIFHALVICFFK